MLDLDNGAQIHVAVSVDRERRCARIDFSGTSAQLTDNFNAPRAITVAAVLYVFRTLVDDEIPLNAGCLKPLEIVVPEGCMLNPRAARGGRCGQRRDFDLRDQCALWGARHHGRKPVHHEQLHVRRLPPSVL